MSDLIETAALTAPAASASIRIAEIKSSLPQLRADAENVQHEILSLAPACEAGNPEAKSRRKKLRARLGDLNDAVADKEAAIVALQPQEAAERAQAKAANLIHLAARIEDTFAARDSAARKVDECMAALTVWVQRCNELGSEAVALCYGLLPENRVGWVAPPNFADLILLNLAAAEIIDREYAPNGILKIARHSMELVARADSKSLLVSVRDAAAKASMTQSEREAFEAQIREREASEIAWIEQERLANGVRQW